MHEKRTSLLNSDLEKIYSQARKLAGGLINLRQTEMVILGRNATEAASLFYWLADLQSGDNVVYSNAEHDSMINIFQYHQDHGNDRVVHNKSSWPYWFFQEKNSFEFMDKTQTNLELRKFHVNDLSSDKLYYELSKVIDSKTKVLLLSHVRRDTGQAIPLDKVIKIAKSINPNLKVLVDGTQALGNLPKVDINKLDCEAYLSSPHKTMNSEVLGVMFLNPNKTKLENYRPLLQQLSPASEQKILRGMLDPSIGITPNSNEYISPADVVGFIDTVTTAEQTRGISGNNFLNFFKKRQELYKYLSSKIQNMPAFDFQFTPIIYKRKSQTPFILNMKIVGCSSYDIAAQLSKSNIFVSSTYDKALPNDQFLRISFQPNTSKSEIDYFITQLHKILKAK